MPNLSYLSPKTVVTESPIHGRGLFARESIAKGEIIATKGGYIIAAATRPELRQRLGPAEIFVTEDLRLGPVLAQEREGGMIFSNHPCAPNIGIQGQIVFAAIAILRRVKNSPMIGPPPMTTPTKSPVIAEPRPVAAR